MGLVALICWRLPAEDRILTSLISLMAVVLFLANLAMLYSRDRTTRRPWWRILAGWADHLVLLLSLMQMASFDMLERVRLGAETGSAEPGVGKAASSSGCQLDLANKTLESGIGVRGEAEAALHASLAASRPGRSKNWPIRNSPSGSAWRS